ncbi:hypothetical protein BO86DRAFT_151514 [Aspergillus japonicus CBS 114.51]|uniref:Secreted protein n=1 Tax=Aspergillus japonicus CBS 114.51 TaxID=1448312 RepID=A0A8T8WVU2_ASPJA|nr:hypothetical protein BO86DRAFT_151514 [Aspergillus japonicus CBS 114.51]RAH79439.1 hypothetical protein BO86DRAFT_151514 [Aspergillus japonicus CBS 114.51]
MRKRGSPERQYLKRLLLLLLSICKRKTQAEDSPDQPGSPSRKAICQFRWLVLIHTNQDHGSGLPVPIYLKETMQASKQASKQAGGQAGRQASKRERG